MACPGHHIAWFQRSLPLQLLPNPVVLQVQVHWNHLEGSLKQRFPHPQSFWCSGPRWSRKIVFLASSWSYSCCWDRIHTWQTWAVILPSDVRGNGLASLTHTHQLSILWNSFSSSLRLDSYSHFLPGPPVSVTLKLSLPGPSSSLPSLPLQ